LDIVATHMNVNIPGPESTSITQSLQDWRAGDDAALNRLTAAVYRELHRMAGYILSGRQASLTVQPTVLVHELYFKLPELQAVDWQSRAHFLNVAAKVMRNILVDHARARQAAKRGGGLETVIADPSGQDRALHIDVLTVSEALDRLAERHARQARVVELRFFGGLTSEEISQVLSADGEEVSLRTVERDWTFSRAWLERNLGPRR
jgi:RNA polymerase sigma factor (TIGR02999 family)